MTDNPGNDQEVIALASQQSKVGFPDSSVGKKSTCSAGDPALIPGLGRSPGEGIGNPLRYSGLENSMDCIVRKELDTTERLSLSYTKAEVLQLRA